ncbi:hypothetical protein KJ564_06685, partial [bacterium]|nr:hypothetical protein [bacterium]
QRISKLKPPEGLIGFSSDLFNPNKLVAFEDKISSVHILDSTECFNKAKEVYEKYKTHVGPILAQDTKRNH